MKTRGPFQAHKERGGLFVLSGPSGSGKTTLAQKLLSDKDLAVSLVRSISFTTRPRRHGERDGKDYFFISEKEFLARRRSKKVLEWTKYLGYYYGTARQFVDEQLIENKGLLLCLDIKGAKRIKKEFPREAVTVFLMPPSLSELRRRILSRGTIDPKELEARLKRAREEIAVRSCFDHVVVNDSLADASEQVKAIIQKKMRNLTNIKRGARND